MERVHGTTRWVGDLDLVGADELLLLGCALVTPLGLAIAAAITGWLR